MDPSDSQMSLARHLAGLVDAEEQARRSLIWMLAKAVQPLPEPTTSWLPSEEEGPIAYWLTKDRLFKVSADAVENPENESEPFVKLAANSWPLTGRAWTVGLESEYVSLGQGRRGGLQTHWSFAYDSATVLAIEGVYVLSPPEDEKADAAEEFARLLAGKVGWLA